MSSQPPDGQGPEQQPPSGTPPGHGPPGLPPRPPPGVYAPGGLGGRPSKSRRVLILGIVGAVVVLTGLAAVFTGDEDEAGDYCGLLEDNGNAFADMVSGNVDPSNFDEAVVALHELREAAPDDVADEWAALDDPFQELQVVIDDAGLSWEELLQIGPQDVDPKLRDAGEKFVADLGSIDVDAIDQTLNDHADEECGLDLEIRPSQAEATSASMLHPFSGSLTWYGPNRRGVSDSVTPIGHGLHRDKRASFGRVRTQVTSER